MTAPYPFKARVAIHRCSPYVCAHSNEVVAGLVLVPIPRVTAANTFPGLSCGVGPCYDKCILIATWRGQIKIGSSIMSGLV